MAIHPIDLQTLYVQMEKVGRQQSAEQQLAANVQEAQQNKNKLDAQKKLSTVQVIEQESQENLRISKDDKQQSGKKDSQAKKNNDQDENLQTKNEEYIKDPSLGQRIDISG